MRRSGLLLWVFVACSFAGAVFTSCEKRVTPKKVERILTKDSWEIKSFVFQGADTTAAFINQPLGFGDEGSLTFLNSGGVTGQWEVSSGKKPTILYISGIPDEPYAFFNDNWEVNTCSKERVTMSADHGSYTNSLELKKISY